MGRPTLYQPEYCAAVIEMGKQGKSLAQMASYFNIDRATLARWEEQRADFGVALARAREHAQAWWEGHAQQNLKAKHYQAQLWRYSMAGRFKGDYSEGSKAIDVTVNLRAALADALPVAAQVLGLKDNKPE